MKKIQTNQTKEKFYEKIIELQHVWNIADYVMWIPLAAMDVFFACFCVFNKLWQYIPVLCMVIAVLEFLPYYVFVARLGENVVTKYNKLFGRQGSIEQILG